LNLASAMDKLYCATRLMSVGWGSCRIIRARNKSAWSKANRPSKKNQRGRIKHVEDDL